MITKPVRDWRKDLEDYTPQDRNARIVTCPEEAKRIIEHNRAQYIARNGDYTPIVFKLAGDALNKKEFMEVLKCYRKNSED